MQPKTQIPKKKRLLVAAIIFVVPAIVIGVLLAGLVLRHKKAQLTATTTSAFSTDHPSPTLPNKEKNKLQIYMEAEQDSIRQSQARAKDPNEISIQNDSSEKPISVISSLTPRSASIKPSGLPRVSSTVLDQDEKKVNDRLQKIYAALGGPGSAESPTKPLNSTEQAAADPGSSDIWKLQQLMAAFQKKDTESNPQLAQVKQVLDEIRDIQHPENIKETPNSQGSRPLPVEAVSTKDLQNPGNTGASCSANGFFGLSDALDSSGADYSSIEAVIHESQTVQSGSIVKMRLLQPIFVGANPIPANSFIYGTATITGERVSIQLTNAVYNSKIYPIALKVYDANDGLEGLYVPGMITRDVVKQNVGQRVNGLGVGSFDQSLGAQAAAATLETARNLLSRKIIVLKATLKAGHLAILRPSNLH